MSLRRRSHSWLLSCGTPAPHAAGDTRRTLEMTMITWLLSASFTRLNQGKPPTEVVHIHIQNHQSCFMVLLKVLLQHVKSCRSWP